MGTRTIYDIDPQTDQITTRTVPGGWATREGYVPTGKGRRLVGWGHDLVEIYEHVLYGSQIYLNCLPGRRKVVEPDAQPAA